MINWALLPSGKSFAPHFHEDMEEVFVITHGRVKITVGRKEADLEPGDAVVIQEGAVHRMENVGPEDAEYMVVGISREKHGRTVVVG